MKENNRPTDLLNEKFQEGKSFARTPDLNHAAGDYEPLEERPGIRPSEDPELMATNPSSENKIMFPATNGDQIDHDDRVEMEAVERESQIEDIRATYGATDPDRN